MESFRALLHRPLWPHLLLAVSFLAHAGMRCISLTYLRRDLRLYFLRIYAQRRNISHSRSHVLHRGIHWYLCLMETLCVLQCLEKRIEGSAVFFIRTAGRYHEAAPASLSTYPRQPHPRCMTGKFLCRVTYFSFDFVSLGMHCRPRCVEFSTRTTYSFSYTWYKNHHFNTWDDLCRLCNHLHVFDGWCVHFEQGGDLCARSLKTVTMQHGWACGGTNWLLVLHDHACKSHFMIWFRGVGMLGLLQTKW